MAETTNIAWTRSTFNPWIGCTKVSPGCDHWHAEVSTPSRAYGVKWGAGNLRRKTSPSTWQHVERWNRAAKLERESGKVLVQSKWKGRPGFWPVFCASLADVFDNEVPEEWRRDLFDLIELTPNLTWMLLTKRIGNVVQMLPTHDWCIGRPNVWLGITVVNQEEAERDIPKLLWMKAHKHWISYEPAIGPIDFSRWLGSYCDHGSLPARDGTGGVTCHRCQGFGGCRGISWIIVGGESDQPGHKARAFDIEWACSTVRQCQSAGVPVFVKQLGSNPAPLITDYGRVVERLWLKDRAGADPKEWPEDLRVREFPE